MHEDAPACRTQRPRTLPLTGTLTRTFDVRLLIGEGLAEEGPTAHIQKVYEETATSYL